METESILNLKYICSYVGDIYMYFVSGPEIQLNLHDNIYTDNELHILATTVLYRPIYKLPGGHGDAQPLQRLKRADTNHI